MAALSQCAILKLTAHLVGTVGRANINRGIICLAWYRYQQQQYYKEGCRGQVPVVHAVNTVAAAEKHN